MLGIFKPRINVIFNENTSINQIPVYFTRYAIILTGRHIFTRYVIILTGRHFFTRYVIILTDRHI